MFLSDDKDYQKYFFPFSFEESELKKRLKNKIKDIYIGIFTGETLCGFYMLRGFDEGYTIPSYGVYIHSDYVNNGLAKLTLFHAFSCCKMLGVKKIMLRVHEENKFAYELYKKSGFVKTGFDNVKNQLILQKELR